MLTPTRELAVQVHNDAAAVGRHLPFRCLAVYGGVDYRKQREDLAKGVDLLVGTPGRLIDYLKQKVYHLRDVEVAVIDEADRMFDMGFIADLRFMLKRMSRFDRRQSLLFSATITDRVMELSYEYMNVPDLIEITPDRVAAEKVEQILYHVNSGEKFRLLLGLLRTESWTKALVFVNTKRVGARLTERLERNGFPSALLSGDVDQVRRLKLLTQVHRGRGADRGRHGRGLAGPARGRHQPRVQLRPAPERRGLRAPHRAHGPCGRPRQGGQPRL